MSKRSEIMEAILQHIADEAEIDEFHKWISDLCDPDSKLVQNTKDKYFKQVEEETQLRLNNNDLPGKHLILILQIFSFLKFSRNKVRL